MLPGEVPACLREICLLCYEEVYAVFSSSAERNAVFSI
jgi:hypothetical protein